jgi:hypothetical protein
MRSLVVPFLLGASLVLGLAAGAAAMGSFGGRESGPPARNVKATFVDADGTRIAATHVSVGGDASLEGEVGRGRLRIPLDNVKSIRFAPVDGERDRVRADVTLREGEPVSLKLRASTTFYGEVPGGAYQIRARDLSAVELGV